LGGVKKYPFQRQISLLFTPGPKVSLVGKFSPKNTKFFPRVKKSYWVGSKNTRVKDESASYLLQGLTYPWLGLGWVSRGNTNTDSFCISPLKLIHANSFYDFCSLHTWNKKNHLVTQRKIFVVLQLKK